MIKAWYLEGLNADTAPASMCELRERFTAIDLNSSQLPSSEKWESIISGRLTDLPQGWTLLNELASFRRGIATGCNEFFLVSAEEADKVGVQERHRRLCVGKSADVRGLCFTSKDVKELRDSGRRVLLLDFSEQLSPSERAYIEEGAASGIQKRYLLKTRKPWFSMEQRPPAPIWAAVFGRGDFRFVLNDAMVLSLTNFHCVFPKVEGMNFRKALCLTLNSSIVRERFAQVGRAYGGGLKKFEPNDLKRIQLPNVGALPNDKLDELANIFDAETANRKQTSLSDVAETRIADVFKAIS